MRLILASQSPTRARLLRAAGVAFETAAAPVDEAALRETLAAERVATADAAVALADLKARRVATSAPPETIVLGCDQILEIDGAWLEKPSDLAAARRQLQHLRGQTHLLATAAVAYRGESRIWHHVELARLTMRAFSDAFLDAYLAGAPEILGSVGAYQIEAAGAQLMTEVIGDHFTVQGLPLLPVLRFLRQQGLLED